MATNFKKSFMTYSQVLIFFLGALLIGSCKEKLGKDEVCIYVPIDKSALGSKNHFIPTMSIDIYKKDFDTTRANLSRAYPDLMIPDFEIFNKASIVEFFKIKKVVGLKFYYGIKPGNDKKQALRLMIVGVDSAGNNVYIKGKGSPLATQASDDEGGLEYGQCNPPCDGFEPQKP
jgi:hypothetical protein